MPSQSANTTTSANTAFQESIRLRPEEQIALETRTASNHFLASVPVPALFVTAHVDLSLSRLKYEALEQLKCDLNQFSSRESKAESYRCFFQKTITRLNKHILRYEKTRLCFGFRGTLERNFDDLNGNDLHFHVFLYEPAGLFVKDPDSIQTTADFLRSFWLLRVNDKVTPRFNPIDIQTISSESDAFRVASYMNKRNPAVHSYEISDDWSIYQSTKTPNRIQ